MRRLRCLFLMSCAALLLSGVTLSHRALAQNLVTQGYAGYTLHLSGSTTTTGVFTAPLTWKIFGPNNGNTLAASYNGQNSNGENGWTVSYSGSSLTVGLSASAAPGGYSVEYCTSETIKNGENEVDTFHLLVANCTVAATPPTLPPAGSPAFSWQGTVGGVNTGNGNKTTTLPIVGWTQRGGMGVSCALYHNSQITPLLSAYGHKWTPSYCSYISQDAHGNDTVHWDSGLSYTYTLNSDGLTYTAPVGILDTLSNFGTRPTLTTTDNTVYTFGYAPASGQPGYGSAFLSAITDMDGNALAIAHNSDTTLSSLTDATGRKLSYGYTGGLLTSVTDPLSRVWSIAYGGPAGTGNLWTLTLPVLNGKTYNIGFAYSTDGLYDITGEQSAGGNTTTYFYDSSNRLSWAKDPYGSKTTFTYNPTNTVITDPNGHTTTQTYQYSQLVEVTDTLGDFSSTAYDVANIVASTSDKNGNPPTSYSSHFTNGTSTSTVLDPMHLGLASTTYDAKNKVVSTGDRIGNTTVNTYSTDGKEDLMTTTVTGNGTTSPAFKAETQIGGYSNGLPTTFTDALNNPSSSVGYDGNGYVNSTTDALDNPATASVYNALGWLMSSTDSNGNETQYNYDNWGRVHIVTAPDNTTTTTVYDPDGNLLTVTDANNHVVTNVYDADDRLTKTTNGRGDVVQYTYDGPSGYGTKDVNGNTQLGLLSSKTDGNNHVTKYTYTARNEPWATYYPDGTSESVTYDPNGNLYTRTKADGNVISYKYDADNRLTTITYPHLTATGFSYDADSRRIKMTDGTGTTTWDYTYDGLHMTDQSTPQGTVYYAFDLDGNRKVMQLAGTGSWNYTYDADNRLHALQSPADGTTTYSYDPAGRMIQKTQGNGAYQKFSYDTANQLTDIGYYFLGGTQDRYLHYGHDPAGNVQTRSEGTPASQGYDLVTTYGYDGNDQLTSEVGSGSPNYNDAYTYDHNGNRLTQTVGGAAYQTFTYDGHDKMLSGTAGNETPNFDANGNETGTTINGGTWVDKYDDEDRLISVAVPSGPTDTFTYNGLGLRVGKVDSTGTYSYVCDGTTPGSPILSDGQAIYTPGLSERRNGSSLFYNSDDLGNLWTADDGTGQAEAGAYLFTGFGASLYAGAGAAGASPLKYGGANDCQTDYDTGLVLMGYRYYDVRTGRFISQDPAEAGNNWYAYVGNSPVNHVDPTGLYVGDPEPDTDQTEAHNVFASAFYGSQSGLSNFFDQEAQSELRGDTEYAASVAIQKSDVIGTADFDTNVKDLLNEIANTEFGANLLAQFIWSNNRVNIKQIINDPGDVSLVTDPSKLQDYGKILFELEPRLEVSTTEGLQIISNDVILVHELGHDISWLEGGDEGEAPDPANGSSYTQNTLTGQDVISLYENPYREEIGLPLRINHSGKVLL